MPESSTRARLHEANVHVETATKALAQAEVLAKKASAELENEKIAFQNSVVVKHQVLEWRINALKENSSDPMPSDLVEARREAASAQENLEHAELVLQRLNHEYESAEQNLKSAQKYKQECVSAVVVEEAQALIAELATVNERRRHLRLVLQGLNIGNGAEANRVAGNLIHAGLQDREVSLPMDRSPIRKASSFWTSFSEALAENPLATAGDYPTWQSLWL
jgi:hypothetical protein